MSTAILKGILIAIFIEESGVGSMGQIEWWAAMFFLNIVANI